MPNYLRQVHVYETDLMGIVHHSNYLRYCEEARVNWCHQYGFIVHDSLKRDEAVFSLTVYETRVKHVRPARYGNQLQIEMQARTEGVRIIFQYRIKVDEHILCLAETIHCRIDQNFKIMRLDEKLVQAVRKQTWTETWL